MGNCLDSCLGRSGPSTQRTSPKEVQLRQQQNWKATGLVGLRDQNLKELPPALQEASTVIKVLDASNNKLQQLPDYISTFSNLQRLVLANNLLVSLPVSIGSLAQLKLLVLDLNQLEELPEELGQLQRLERLSVYSCRLVRLPRSVGSLKALQVLNLGHNQLAYLPPEIGQCSQLEELDASSNSIKDLPPELGKLQKLKTLQLDNNLVTAVPSEVLHGCVCMQTLSLHGNPIKPDALQETDGFGEFEQRRRSKYNKAIAGGALLNKSGLDEGVDRAVAGRAG